MLMIGMFVFTGPTLAEEKMTADQIAKELSNPTTPLASLNTSLVYSKFKGDLPNASDQDSWRLEFQPSLPFTLSNGYNVFFRPLVPVLLDQPVFDAGELDFDSEGIELGDISGDIAYGRTDKDLGLLYLGGMYFSAPTATDNDVGSGQWRLGPEVALGVIRDWGLVGALMFHQWNVGGWRDDATSITSMQYFYAIGLGNGWQLAASPVASYDWQADSDDAWTIPLGIGVSKTTAISKTPVKFAMQAFYYAKSPDSFGQDWGLKFTITPVIKNPFTH
jgi:hypothetical protein